MCARFCRFVGLILLVACSGKKRAFVDTVLEGPDSGSSQGSETTPAVQQRADSGDLEAAATTSDESEGPLPIGSAATDDRVSDSMGGICDVDASVCTEPDDKPSPPVCIPGPRDCRSDLDNNCDVSPTTLSTRHAGVRLVLRRHVMNIPDSMVAANVEREFGSAF